MGPNTARGPTEPEPCWPGPNGRGQPTSSPRRFPRGPPHQGIQPVRFARDGPASGRTPPSPSTRPRPPRSAASASPPTAAPLAADRRVLLVGEVGPTTLPAFLLQARNEYDLLLVGYVGNKSAVFPLQLLGFDVDPINSVQFSNHTGYPTFRGQVLNGNELWDLIEGLEENELLHYTHLLTGYIGSVSFLNAVLQVVDKLRSVNPDLTYVCDPVLGDEGKLYVPQELISVYQQKVVPVSSMLTPNEFEVELLTGLRITSEQDGLTACNTLHSAGPRKVVITSALIEGRLLLIGSHKKTEEHPPEQFKIEIPKIPAYFTGTGDLATALLLGWSNKYPDNLETAAELAVSSLQAVLKRTVEDYKRAGFDPSTSSLEIRLIQSQDDIRNPARTCKAVKYS
ncbi:pyridoxal kinase-like isoform X2 [Phragmites australis]|uniref:pyridoxal kinase-like isoform X2 n=1 Tax=Phragmites australis TaxID=29695 RepID=UPI002D7A1669|nr:pyridoxal kinase-like isoform X2 [Phragmites australis]